MLFLPRRPRPVPTATHLLQLPPADRTRSFNPCRYQEPDLTSPGGPAAPRLLPQRRPAAAAHGPERRAAAAQPSLCAPGEMHAGRPAPAADKAAPACLRRAPVPPRGARRPGGARYPPDGHPIADGLTSAGLAAARGRSPDRLLHTGARRLLGAVMHRAMLIGDEQQSIGRGKVSGRLPCCQSLGRAACGWPCGLQGAPGAFLALAVR